MSSLVAVTFEDPAKAFDLRTRLVELQKEYLIDMEDVVVVTKDDQGKVKLHQAVSLTAMGAVGGGFWGMLIGMLFLRNEVEATILRLPGQLYERKDNNIIRNFYSYKLINKTTREIPDIRFELLSQNGEITVVRGAGFEVPAQDLSEGTLYIDINNAALSGDKDKLEIGIYSGDQLIETATARFLAPRSYR